MIRNKEIKRMLWWATLVYGLDFLLVVIIGFRLKLVIDLLLWSSGIIVMPMIFNTKSISRLRITIYVCFLTVAAVLYYLTGMAIDRVLYFLCGCIISASVEREFWIKRNPQVLTEDD